LVGVGVEVDVTYGVGEQVGNTMGER